MKREKSILATVKKMSRNVERPNWRNGDRRRRSPRVSTKVDDDTEEKGGGSPPTKSRTKIKRKFNQNEMESIQYGNKRHNEDQLTTCGEPNTKLPEKRILELILDTLQRRDVHEIFAEPVDSEEVENYYEIIENPMDFGTMRAKLHEGLYQNLQQFERDIFLIPKNAMHFNSANSIYYRQARGIYEAAEKLFGVLKSDPERFELEFPREKRRSITRAMGKTKSVNSSMGTIDQPHKYSNSGQLVSRRTQGTNRKYSFLSSGGRKNGKFESCEADRRSTHALWQPSFNDVFSSVDGGMHTQPKQLYLINQQDISYEESLMSFVKDLGPTAQTIAKKKLQQWQPHNFCNKTSVLKTHEKKSVFSTAIGRIPSWMNPDTLLGSRSHTVINKKPIALGDPVGIRDWPGALSAKKVQQGNVGMPENNAEKNGKLDTMFSEMKPAVLTPSKKDILSTKSKKPAIDSKEIRRCNVGNLTSVSGNRSVEGKADDARRSDDIVLPVILALEHPRLDNACDQLKPGEKKSSNDQSSAVWQSNHKEAPLGFLNSQATSSKAENDGVKKTFAFSGFSYGAKAANDGVKKTPAPSGFSFAAPLLNQAHLTDNQRSGQFQGHGLDGFSKLRYQGAVDNSRGWQEETGSSSNQFLHDGFNNQLRWPNMNPPATNFVPNPLRGFVLNGNTF